MDDQAILTQSKPDHRPPQEAILEVQGFDAHGTARARFKNKWIEVEHGIPGETVEALVYGKRRMWAKIVNVIDAAPDRVTAPCPYFHEGCGGCQWQMIAYDSQLQRKREQIDEEMAAAGLDLRVAEMHAMDDPWRYRYTAGLSLGRQAGFRRHGSQSIVGLQDCPISHPLIGAFAAHINEVLAAEGLPNYRGQMSLELRVADSDDSGQGLHVAIKPAPGFTHDVEADIMPLANVVAAFPPVMGVCYRWREQPPQQLIGHPFVTIRVADRPFVASAATFFQTNLVLLPRLMERLREAARPAPSDVVVDVYGGVGLFGLYLAPHVGRVVEIELDPVGIEAGRQAVTAQGLTNVDFVAGTAEAVLARMGRVDTMIVDPPRTGLTPKVIAAIEETKPRTILYVSCLANSLARDIAELRPSGYEPDRLDAFDFYPQTYHVELFTALRRAG